MPDDNRNFVDRQEQLREAKERKEHEQAHQDQLVRDREKLMRSAEFRRVMADILARGGMFRTAMTGNSTTYHLLGRQDFAREIWSDLAKADHGAAFDLLKPTWANGPE